MSNFIISTLICFLSFYGLYELIHSLFYIKKNNRCYLDNASIIITVHNQENNIEYFLKNSINNLTYNNISIPKVTFVDLNSTDDTLNILKYFCKDFSYIKVMSLKEYLTFLEQK